MSRNPLHNSRASNEVLPAADDAFLTIEQVRCIKKLSELSLSSPSLHYEEAGLFIALLSSPFIINRDAIWNMPGHKLNDTLYVLAREYAKITTAKMKNSDEFCAYVLENFAPYAKDVERIFLKGVPSKYIETIIRLKGIINQMQYVATIETLEQGPGDMKEN